MPIDLYPSVAKVKRNGVYENLPGFVTQTGDESAQQMIATAENTSTAQYAHEKNSYFRLNGVLYQADSNINVGDSIVVGYNCHVAVLSDAVTILENESGTLDSTIEKIVMVEDESKDFESGTAYISPSNNVLVKGAASNRCVIWKENWVNMKYYHIYPKDGYQIAVYLTNRVLLCMVKVG